MLKLIPLDKKVVENTTYIKLVENKTHFGPVSEEKIARAKATALSAAANKVRLMADFTVKVKTSDTEKDKEQTNARSYQIIGVGEDPLHVAASALLLMQAWDKKYGVIGTPDYKEKLSRALRARTTAYTELGINPNSKDKPNLTSDQRVFYNEVVGPTAFDYYEYHLAFKLEGQKKFARSKTYRSLRKLALGDVLRVLRQESETIKSNIDINTRQSN